MQLNQLHIQPLNQSWYWIFPISFLAGSSCVGALAMFQRANRRNLVARRANSFRNCEIIFFQRLHWPKLTSSSLSLSYRSGSSINLVTFIIIMFIIFIMIVIIGWKLWEYIIRRHIGIDWKWNFIQSWARNCHLSWSWSSPSSSSAWLWLFPAKRRGSMAAGSSLIVISNRWFQWWWWWWDNDEWDENQNKTTLTMTTLWQNYFDHDFDKNNFDHDFDHEHDRSSCWC